MNFQRSTAKSPKIPGGWQHFATKFIEIEIFTLTDFSRQSCRCKQEFQGKKGKIIFSRGLDWRIVLLLNPSGTQGRQLSIRLLFQVGFPRGKHAREVFPGTIIQTTENSTPSLRKTLHPLAFTKDKARKDARLF